MSDINILVVDDDPHMLEALAIYVESAGYSPVKANNGLEALTVIEKMSQSLHAIVSDVDMPELDGYELCQQVREIDAIKGIPFIFVSAKTNLEEILKGYDSGGNDYITKPLEGKELIAKLNNIIENNIRHHDLDKQLADTRNAAMQAMSYSSNLGQVLQFMKASAEVSSHSDLANKLFETADGLGLIFVVQFQTAEGVISYKKDSQVSPLEANVIELSRSKGRIFDFQSRTIFNYNDFSLLILNMPVDDQEKYGLIKDVLGSLCDAVDSRVKLLSTDAAIKQKDEILNTINASLQHIDKSYRDVQQANMSAMDEMIHRMEDAMFGFGLSETQEDTVRGIVMMAKNKAKETFEDGKELYNEFENIKQVLINGLK